VRRVLYALVLIVVLALAGGFPAYLAIGQGSSSPTVTITVTAQPVYTPTENGVEDGWSGVAVWDGEPECPAGGVSTAGKVTAGGLVIQPIIIVSFDERLCLTIDVGTIILGPDGSCPRCIGVCEMTTLPSPPEEACIIGCMYDAFPDGVTFVPPATLQYCYDPNDIPEGIALESLVIAGCDPTSGQWVEMDCVVDSEANTITAELSQFCDSAVLGYEAVVPAPASFEVSSLDISPAEVEIGETVNITVLVANTGGRPGSCQVMLKINGVAEEVGAVVIDAGASEQVSFTTSKDTPGLYRVDVNGLTGSFDVNQPLPPAEPVNWWLIGGIIAAVAIVAFVVFILRRIYYVE